MSAVEREALWSRLRDAELVEGDVPAPDGSSTPWYVRVMLGVTGWIGALFLLGFVGTGFVLVLESPVASWIVGAAACGGAATILRASPKGDLAAQFGLAVSLAGQALMVFAYMQWADSSLSGAGFAVAVQQAVLFALVPNFVHRVWTSWSCAVALVFACSMALSNVLFVALAPAAVTAAFAVVWLREFDHAGQGEMLRAGGYGLALAVIHVGVVHASGLHATLWDTVTVGILSPRLSWQLGTAAMGVVVLGTAVALLRREGLPLASGEGKAALAGTAILALASVEAFGVGPAIVILVLGFANGNRALVGLGVATLLAYLSHYYYSLHATLLVKSALLAGLGVALLAARFALQRWWPSSSEVARA
ncbi:MAG: DUF4401 domain-containing protein [Deltaproteobacteria bacterium]|nr:DUF4401 domain-containing protein [Deltaproteobacteria bacterium]